MARRLHPLAAGTLWITGAILISQVAQLGYSIVSSRLLGPASFGAFATALAAMSLLTILAIGGLDLAVARESQENTSEVRSLVSAAILLGLVWGAVVILAAPWWADLWGDASATGVLRMLAIAVTLTPLNAVIAGLARQTGRFRQLSSVQAVATITGVAVGVVAVIVTESPYALAVPLDIAALITTLMGPWATGRWLWPGRLRRTTWAYLNIGGKAMATNLIEYSGWALVQWATGRGAGAAALGQLNRGLAFASMPIMAVATSMSNVLVPTYGSTSDRSQHPSLLSRATALSVWAGTLLAALSAGLVYPLMPVVLGGEWSTAASLAVFLAIGSGGSVAGQPMAVFLQSQGRFAEFRRVQYITTALYVFAAAGVIETGHVLWAAVSYAAVTWVRFGLLWARLRVTGELRAWIGREVRIAIVAAGAGGLLVFALAMSCVDRALPLSVSISALAGVVGSLVLIRLGSKVPVLIRELVR